MLSKTKGAILIPTFYNNSFLSVGRYIKLLGKLHTDFGYDLVHANDFKDTSYDIVILLKSPNKGAFDLMESVVNFPKTTKVIMYIVDLHDQPEIDSRRINTGDTPFNRSMRRMCARADLILCPYKTTFLHKFGEFKHKLIFFPHFVDDDLNYRLKPKKKTCLISGATCPKVYPLRSKLASKARKHPYNDYMSVLNHPGYSKKLKNKDMTIGGDFLKCISGHTCAVATPSIFDYVVGKHFEIPAAGVILLAKDTPDLVELGFKDMVNFIEINDKNALDKIKQVVYNGPRYEKIRLAGKELVVKNYTKNIAYTKLVSSIEHLFKEF